MKISISAIAAIAVAPLSLLAEDKVDFAKDVLPVLEEKCMGCHREAYTDAKTGRTKKPKSGYRMDTAELIVGEGDENDANITAKKPDDSPVYSYTQLDEEDDWFMPPKGDALTEEEAETLKKWIEEGAEFGDWTETKFNPDGTKADGDDAGDADAGEKKEEAATEAKAKEEPAKKE